MRKRVLTRALAVAMAATMVVGYSNITFAAEDTAATTEATTEATTTEGTTAEATTTEGTTAEATTTAIAKEIASTSKVKAATKVKTLKITLKYNRCLGASTTSSSTQLYDTGTTSVTLSGAINVGDKSYFGMTDIKQLGWTTTNTTGMSIAEMSKLNYVNVGSQMTEAQLRSEFGIEDSATTATVNLYPVFTGTPKAANNTGTYNYDTEGTKYTTDAIASKKTTSGITCTVGDYKIVRDTATNSAYIVCDLVYTIPADFNESKLDLNITEDAIKAVEEIAYLPGYDTKFNIVIVNNSKYNYDYTQKSFTVSTSQIKAQDDSQYSATIGEDGKLTQVEGTIDGAKGFDGNDLMYYGNVMNASNRTANEAILSLIGKTTASAAYMTDEYLGKLLVEAGYANGIKDLNKYYLDYFNEKYGENATKIEDLSSTTYKKVFSGNRYTIRETNVELAEATYNYFYSNCLYLMPATENVLKDADVTTADSVWAYMKDYNENGETKLESSFVSALTGLNSNTSANGSFSMYVHGMNTTNTYMNLSFGFDASFSMNRQEKIITINYYDKVSGKVIDTQYVSASTPVGEAYDVDALTKKEIAGYTWDSVEYGNEDTTAVAGTLTNDLVFNVYYNPQDEPYDPTTETTETTTSTEDEQSKNTTATEEDEYSSESTEDEYSEGTTAAKDKTTSKNSEVVEAGDQAQADATGLLVVALGAGLAGALTFVRRRK